MTTLGTLTASPIGFGCMALSHIYGGTTEIMKEIIGRSMGV